MVSDDRNRERVTLAEAAVAHKLIFGADPVDARDLVALAGEGLSPNELCQTLFRNAGFREKPDGERVRRYLDAPPAAIQVQVSPDLLARMMQRIEGTFDELGRTEPHWAVLTAERFRSANFNRHRQEFFDSGKYEVSRLEAFARRAGIDLSTYDHCFELGCGVGRITGWLADLFGFVTAADISAPLLDLARESVRSSDRDNVRFLHLNRLAMLEAIPDFDVFYSVITFQHNPPPVIHYLLSIVLERLNPGGVALFQVPTFRADYEFSAEAYLNKPPEGDGIEIHVLPQRTLFDLFTRRNCRILEMREDGACGPSEDITSETFFVQKRS